MSSNDRNILLVVPLIVALVVVWFLLVSPKQDQVKKLDQQVSSLQGQVQSQQQSISEGTQARRQFPGAYQRLVVSGKAVPATDETASLLVQVDRAASASGVSFRSIDAGGSAGSGSSGSSATGAVSTGTVDASGLTEIPYTLTFNGTFFQIADFISRIDRLVKPKGNRIVSNGRLTTIHGFTLGPDNPRPLPALAVTVDITTYLSGPAPAAAAGSASSGATATPTSSSSPTSTSSGSTSKSGTSSTPSTSSSTAATSSTPTSAPASP
jgi:Tfp pilus assembly protein PilO